MPLEDELREALGRAGDGFTPDRQALTDAGERRGRQLVARRRAAVIGGSALALALIGTASAYTGGLLGGSGSGSDGSGSVDVAAPPTTSSGRPEGSAGPKTPGVGTGAVSAAQMIALFKELLPGGQLTGAEARGSDDSPYVSAVYDDGAGKAAISLALSRVDPNGTSARELTQCGDKSVQDYDDCLSEQLPDGSRILLHKGYEYPDRRVDTKLWRAVLVTPQGFQIDASEWNAPAEKGAAISRPNPPLSTAQLKALVTSEKWHPALKDLPAAPQERAPQAPPSGPEAGPILQSLLAKMGIPVVSQGDQGAQSDYAYAVLDDGKGKSMVQVNAQPNMAKTLGAHIQGPDVTTLPDGTKVKMEQKPGEKGGAGVVWWTVDTLRPDGFRVVVSAFNTSDQNKPATRKTPLLTMDQLKEIALSPQWNTL
ncbi:hypothetical protein ACF059_18855 [Streptomyces sp. NPDC016562]|uniref:hypothetical protein n=1 Tax=Streptomyces sp. NPDC016562 TaxID=3364966 RepID=UPI0036FA926A